MSSNGITEAGRAMGKPLKPVAVVTILGVILALGAGLGIAYWNGADRVGKPYVAQPGNPYYKLELSRILLDTNYVAPNRLIFGASGGTGGTESAKTPVPYLPLNIKPTPTPQAFKLSGSFKAALHEIAAAKLEQGGMGIAPEFIPDPKDSNSQIPAPEGSMSSGNGYVRLYYQVERDSEQTGALQFRVSYEVWRQVYVTHDAPFHNTLKVDEGASGPFRVREKDLEPALIYETEKLIQQIVGKYRQANPKPAGK